MTSTNAPIIAEAQKLLAERDAAISTKRYYEDVAQSAERNLVKATNALENTQEEAAMLRQQVSDLTEQRNEAQRQALMYEDRADADSLLRLVDTIKETGGCVEIHGVKIQRCDERGQTY